MEKSDLLSPDNGWRVEALEMAEAEGLDRDRAYDRVMLRYLSEGDARPLMDMLRLGRRPDLPAQKCIAMMLDRDFKKTCQNKFPYEIRIQRRRGRGRPKREAIDSTLPILVDLRHGIAAIISNRSPKDGFWQILLRSLYATLEPERYKEAFGALFPLKAELVPCAGQITRPRNPELGARGRALASFVQQAIKQGNTYEAALRTVAKQHAVSAETARDAYSKYRDMVP